MRLQSPTCPRLLGNGRQVPAEAANQNGILSPFEASANPGDHMLESGDNARSVRCPVLNEGTKRLIHSTRA
jgi:hypothetical protein